MKAKAKHKKTPRPKTALVRKPAPRTPSAPHVTAPRPLGPPQPAEIAERINRSETIEAGFEVWQELREHHRAALARLMDDRRKLEQQGEFVIGAVRAARDGGTAGAANGTALAKGSGLDTFLSDASEKLEQAKRELEAAAQASAAKWEDTFRQVRGEVRGRVQRQLKLLKPKLRLRLRALAGDKRILHLDRPGPDDAVLLCWLFSGKLPSRYGFLFDDSTDDLRETPPTLYPDEGVLAAQVRPDAHALKLLLDVSAEAIPLKGMLLVRVPTLLRLLERGPVMEVEIADGASFRNVLARDEAERVAGHLLKMKLEGLVELELFAE